MGVIKQMKLWAYGDSFVAGDQDIPDRIDAILENMEYNRYNVSFASVLAKKLNVTLTNRAISGCSNFVQLDQLWLDCTNMSSDDLILFGITTPLRDRFMIPHLAPEFLRKTRGPGLINRSLLHDHPDTRICTIDTFYTFSVLEKLEKMYNLNIVKFNLFHDPLQDASEEDIKKFNFNNYIGLATPGNTLLDILTDNWGNGVPRISDHSNWKPEVNSHLFTRKSHPNIEGHKKIAEWLENELKKMQAI
jgi:hypothetical protein